ncbi:hypothetical protein KA977_11330 [Candidatus Dependentiae bacterium]|nr:hypothetical protein [Candidatus Dependentiae bacterium]
MVGDLSIRLKIIKADLKKLESQVQHLNDLSGTYDEWKEILKLSRHIEALSISRMAVIKYAQATGK